MEKKSMVNNNRMLTWSLVLMPTLSLYGINALNIDFGTIFVLICLIITIGKNRHIYIQINGNKCWYIYIVYICISMTFPCLWGDGKIIAGRTMKNILYIMILIVCTSHNLITFNYLKNCYLKVAKIVTYYIIIQSILYYSIHIILPGYINKFLISESYGERLTQAVGLMYRPTSLFYEPSHYFEYVAPALILSLFTEDALKKNNILFPMLITIGIIASTSGMGIISVIICWGIWIWNQMNFKSGLKINYKAFIISIIFVFFGILFLGTNYAQKIICRLMGNGINGNTYTAVNARTDVYQAILGQNILCIIFGNGYGNTIGEYYYPSWAFNLCCLGLIGTIIIILIYIKYFIKANCKESKMLVFINAFLCIGTTLFMGKNMLLYFLIIILLDSKDICERF